jgi:DNA-directed RNA polymerase subunit K/omega
MRITRFERARLISARALQLSLGAPPLVKIEGLKTAYDIAKGEFEQNALPLTVIRRHPNGTVERA